jgi:T5orf172 domain-containing protein
MTEGTCIYVVGPIGDCLKIGFTGDLSCRMSKLRQEYGNDVSCLFSIAVLRNRVRRVERRVHELLNDNWRGRELFSVPLGQAVAATRQAIDELSAGRVNMDDKPNKTTSRITTVRVPDDVRDAVRRLAKADRRPVSSWVEKFVIDNMQEKGLLPKDGDQ